MKKLLLAAATVVSMGTFASAQTIDMVDCQVTIQEIGIAGIATYKTVDGADIQCMKGTKNNRDWLLERLETQVHYFGKVVEVLGQSVGDNGAYWGNVLDARNAIQDLKDEIADLEDEVAAKDAKIATLENQTGLSEDFKYRVCKKVIGKIDQDVFAVHTQPSSYMNSVNKAVAECNTLDGVDISVSGDGIVQSITNSEGRYEAYEDSSDQD